MDVARQFERIDGVLGELELAQQALAQQAAASGLLAGQRTMEVRSPRRPYTFTPALHSR